MKAKKCHAFFVCKSKCNTIGTEQYYFNKPMGQWGITGDKENEEVFNHFCWAHDVCMDDILYGNILHNKKNQY